MNLSRLIPLGFVLAGLSNIFGMLFFSNLFSNTYLSELYPQVFSPFGITAFVIWGLAYIAVAKHYEQLTLLISVFVLDKLLWSISWLVWIFKHLTELPTIWGKSQLTAFFYATYGLVDLVFGVFFAAVVYYSFQSKSSTS